MEVLHNLTLPLAPSTLVEIVKPAVGSDGIGFAEYVGTFDSLLDTISNERSVNGRPTLEDGDDDDADENDRLWSSSLNSPKSVLSLLKTRHSCHTYVDSRVESGSFSLVLTHDVNSSMFTGMFPP
jgi:hypothetical protein